MQSSVQFILAFVVVLALIGLTAWLVRRFAGNRLGNNTSRGRLPRLAVIDAAAVDGRRRLVLVRRDNVEHLLMIGGPSDIVVEPNIVRAMPGREQAPQRGGLAADVASRGPSLPEAPSWAESNDSGFDSEPHVPEPAPRPARPSFIEEPRRPAAPLPERRPDPVASLAPEPAPRPEPGPRNELFPQRPIPRSEMPRAEMPRSEPMMPRPMRADPPIRTMPQPRTPDRPVAAAPTPPAPVVTAPAPAPVVAPPVPTQAPTPPAPAVAVSSADQNLADMAQRLEAALRRPAGETRQDAPEPRVGAPSVAPEAPSIRPASRSPEVSIASPARAEAPPVVPPVKSGFENLEDEMASLLGRPKSSS
ncbi:flagellar biosynthetic protein FliO [Tardiphaga sp. 37S4]|nr:flagellar biosynthetic protein FliO [Tardiphaga sp. 37S4]UFS78653.1 flagellar biosynthetic protein FliO [Tardiphaga sp. 37S4]